MATTMRVGILTGGGDCPGLNAVIRAAVKVGIERHGFEMFGIEDAFNGLLDLDYASPDGNRWLTERDVRDILDRGGTILGTTNRGDPFHLPEKGADGKVHEVDASGRLFENFRKIGLDALISIGGDGSMRIADRLGALGLPIVGVPKTIDNDLGATDVTFGFDTAVGIATEAIDRLRDTAESHDRVMIVEVMGRDAGWIALHAGIAGGADAILLPEIPYRIDPLARMIASRCGRGRQHYSIVVVAEGAKPLGGDVEVVEHRQGAMRRLGGAGQRVADQLAGTTSADVRVTVLGHLQRGGTPSAFDRILATRFGAAAAELVAARDFGKMVALRDDVVVTVPISEAVRANKQVSPRGELVRTARSLGVVFGDEGAA